MASRLKAEGAHQAMRRRGLELPRQWIAHERFDLEGGRAGLATLFETLNPRPTGIVCANDLIAIGVLAAAAERGLRVPHDLSVVGFDGTPVASYCSPALTTIEQPVAAIAEKAVAALIELGEGTSLPNYVFRPRLRVGASTAPASESPGG